MGTSADRKARVIASAEALFKESVRDLEAPGGDGRSSYRLVFSDRTIIATLRPNFRRTHVEAFTLRQLGQHCDDLPECLGVDGEILFQSDVGGRRLNLEIAKAGRAAKADLAHRAVSAIFRIQAAGRAAGLSEALPHLGQNDAWLEGLVAGTDILADFSEGRSAAIDRDQAKTRLARPGRQFVKWDCRSGNAAIGADDRLRWFDFEYSGARHGAEDLAWLIGDEAWPLAPEDMEAIVVDAYDPAQGDTLDAYLDYLALYLTFHAAQRFDLLIDEVRRRGWRSKTRVRKYDSVGMHPEFAAHICRVGAYFAARNALTQPMARDFEEAERHFRQVIRSGIALAEA
ncbi:hypothetical protein LR948_01065 [Roseivivax sp. GX 12232]|uniref:hypothetical protein n=1 Tax=Roseivivax sp. GX 12232 TaxID=2900547 RepID=UPI001E418302|nr:hypothetical protein [Roseivivax sp. GX 12232]MCE0503935.1 hypothetical protein [Roseivivax sp. GX 12232]